MLALNWVRYLNGIKASFFTTALGALALIAGLGSLLGVELPLFALFLLLVGVGLVLRPLFGRGSCPRPSRVSSGSTRAGV